MITVKTHQVILCTFVSKANALGWIFGPTQTVEKLAAELNRIADAPPGESPLINKMDWWAKANTLKQRALYVDFSGSAWWGPIQ